MVEPLFLNIIHELSNINFPAIEKFHYQFNILPVDGNLVVFHMYFHSNLVILVLLYISNKKGHPCII